MGKIQIPKKIRFEDFDANYKDIIEKIGFAFNPFSDEVYQLLSGNIDTSNLNRQIVNVSVQTDATGALINPPQVKLTVNGKVQGLNVINAVNQINSSTYPVSAPFVSFSTNAKTLSISNVTGLQPSSQYLLTLEIIV